MEVIQKQSNEKSWAVFAHLSALSSIVIPFGNILGPLIVWLAKKGESELVDKHGKESLNFQISFFIYTILLVTGFLVSLFSNLDTLQQMEGAEPYEVLSYLSRFLSWIIPMMLLGLFKLILVIIASLKAGNDQFFRYPLCIRFIN